MLVLDLLLELPQLRAVGCRAICLQYLDVPVLLSEALCIPGPIGLLISERRDLLLLDLVVGEVLLVLLPALARCGRHVYGRGGGERGVSSSGGGVISAVARRFGGVVSVVSEVVERGYGCGGDGCVGVDEAIRGVGASGRPWHLGSKIIASPTARQQPRVTPHDTLFPSLHSHITHNGSASSQRWQRKCGFQGTTGWS